MTRIIAENRYMDFPKFVSTLKEGALWFSRADLLGDPLERSFTLAREIERQRRILQRDERARNWRTSFATMPASHPRVA